MRITFFRILAFVSCLYAGAVQASGNAVIVPTSGWLVGPSTLVADEEGGLPCVMANQFSNGFVMRISGGGEQVMGLVLDTRQNMFTPGKTYELGVAIGSGFRKIFKAEAYDAATVMTDTRSAPEFYKSLRDARSMKVVVNGRTHEFVMLGARDGLDRVESCFTPGKRAARRGTEPAPAPVASADGAKAGMHTSSRVIANASESGVAAAYRALMAGDPGAPALPVPPVPAGETPGDSAGQTMPPRAADDTSPAAVAAAMAAAGEEAAQPAATEPAAGGTDLASRLGSMFGNAEKSMKSAQPVPPLAPDADKSALPSLQKAPDAPRVGPVMYQGQALAQNWTQPVIAPRAPSPPRQVRVPPPAAETPAVPAVPAVPAASDGTAGDWRALAGMDLRQVFDNWAYKANAKVLWQAGEGFRLPATVAAQGTFESAVTSALRQFDGSAGAPQGHVYVDLASGQKVLVVTRR